MIDISLNLKYASNGIYQNKKKKRMKLPKNLNSQTHMAYFSKKKKKATECTCHMQPKSSRALGTRQYELC